MSTSNKELRAVKAQLKKLEQAFSSINALPTNLTVKVKTVNIYITTPGTELITNIEP